METPPLSALQTGALPWWRTEVFDQEEALPDWFNLAGPMGVALVRAWPDGCTDPGWGLQGAKGDQDQSFMPKYLRNEFNAKRVLFGYERDRWAFAVVMRSVQMICIDIDGKNDGFDHAKKLGLLPPTLAETSKSGNGFHLFYRTPEEWDPDVGFGMFADHIGIEQGVDIRAGGCVYHHKTQRWNTKEPVPLPVHLQDLLLAKRQRREANNERITQVIQSGDDMETLMLHDELKSELKKPIGQGKRNTTLFAIGQKMKAAAYPDWEDEVHQRAVDVGLDYDEADKLVSNIRTYN